MDKKDKNEHHHQSMEDEWEYLEIDILRKQHGIDTCSLYKYIYYQWKLELNSLLKEFSSLFFYLSSFSVTLFVFASKFKIRSNSQVKF